MPGPIGSFSAGRGLDLSPWLETQRVRASRSQSQAARQQADQQFRAEMEYRAQQAANSAKMAASELRVQDRNQTANRDQQRYLADRDFGLRQTDDSRQASRDEFSQKARLTDQELAAAASARADDALAMDKTNQKRGIESDDANKQRVDKEREDTRLANDVGTRATGIIAQSLPALRERMATELGREPTARELQAEMLRQTADLPAEDRAAVQAAIDSWYRDEVEAALGREKELSKPQRVARLDRRRSDVAETLSDLKSVGAMLKDPAIASSPAKVAAIMAQFGIGGAGSQFDVDDKIAELTEQLQAIDDELAGLVPGSGWQ